MNGAVECRSALKYIHLKSFKVDFLGMVSSKYFLSFVFLLLTTDLKNVGRDPSERNSSFFK